MITWPGGRHAGARASWEGRAVGVGGLRLGLQGPCPAGSSSRCSRCGDRGPRAGVQGVGAVRAGVLVQGGVRAEG